MKKLRHFLTFILLAHCTLSFAQPSSYNKSVDFLNANSNWAFGDHAGLSFNSGIPKEFQTSMYANEGCATVSDPVTRKLLFYSNGEQVWNADHNIMPNGDSLKGNSCYSSTAIPNKPGDFASSSQGVCIVPVIGSQNKYYLFSLVGGTVSNGILKDGVLFYNVIDMGLDAGRGDVEPKSKNKTVTYDTLSEALVAVPGSHCDVWLLAISTYKLTLLAFHITEEGIDTVPVVSGLGIQSLPFGSIYSINPSPDRSKLAIIGPGQGILGEFNPTTGKLTNLLKIEKNIGGGSTAFSPDNSKLYLFSNALSGISQFDISNFNERAVNASVQNIPLPTTKGSYNSFRLYNDTLYFVTNLTPSNKIHRINSPNLAGIACGVEEDALQVTVKIKPLAGMLGNEVVFPIKDTLITKVNKVICSADGAQIRPSYENPKYEYLWSNGSKGPGLSIFENGSNKYWVVYGDNCSRFVDSFTVTFDLLFTAITVNNFQLGTTGGPFASYQWLLRGVPINGATNATYNVLENGPYQVIITNKHGCIDTSEVYVVSNHTGFDQEQFLINNITISPNPSNGKLDLFIDWQKANENEFQFAIHDLNGRSVYQQKLFRHNAKESHQLIDLENKLAKGLYVVSVVGTKTKSIQKLVIH